MAEKSTSSSDFTPGKVFDTRLRLIIALFPARPGALRRPPYGGRRSHRVFSARIVGLEGFRIVVRAKAVAERVVGRLAHLRIVFDPLIRLDRRSLSPLR